MDAHSNRLKVEYVPIAQLKPDPFNPRVMPREEMAALVRSIQQFGFAQPLVVRRQGMRLVGGHQRMQAARRLGFDEVPCILLDLSEEQARVLNLALNRISGRWDEDLLARLFQELQVAEVDVSLSGFGEDEMAEIVRSLERREKRHRVESFDVEAALADAEKVQPRTKLGDLYLLGPHRLLCGDSSQPEALVRLMVDDKADMVFTDPPYGVSYVPEERPTGDRTRPRRRLGGILNDEEPEAMIEAAWENMVAASREGTVYYVCAGGRIVLLLHRLFRETCKREPTVIVWGKESFSLTRRDYQRQHEFIFYGWLGKKHYWCGDRKQSDLWLESREPTSTYSHPTQKPLALVERALRNSSQEDDLVLDPFLGSGTTLIAAERMGRLRYGAGSALLRRGRGQVGSVHGREGGATANVDTRWALPRGTVKDVWSSRFCIA